MFAHHYRQVAAAYPQAERIYPVQDNWSIHRHPDVLAVVADMNGLHASRAKVAHDTGGRGGAALSEPYYQVAD